MAKNVVNEMEHYSVIPVHKVCAENYEIYVIQCVLARPLIHQ